jgi:hypothetical protein
MTIDNNSAALSMRTLKEIPTPAAGATSISGLVKEGGRVVGYQLADGRQLSKQDAVQLARAGGLMGVGISERNGNEYLKSIPDGTEGNNLSSLPAVPKNGM